MSARRKVGGLALACAVNLGALVGCSSKDASTTEQAASSAPHAHDAPERAGGTVAASVKVAQPVEPGRPAELAFAFADGSGRPLDDFQVVHEKRLHLFVVSDDLAFFDHVHPSDSATAPGNWSIAQSFPRAGTYHLYADFTSASEGAHMTKSDLEVPGDRPAPAPLVASTEPTQRVGDLAITAKFVGAPIPSGDAMLEYSIADERGAAVTDLEPYLGAFGHLFILKDDRVTTVHAHPLDGGGAHGGPKLTFHASLPGPGKYKLWAQFQRRGEVMTAPWVIEVSEAPAPPNPHAHHRMH
ncbi:MAG: hypothetical protein U0414_30505 [Polyangiaceae bacterium]